MDLKGVLDTLWNNWAFRLSLSSNELFHSNALQYLAERRVTAPPEDLPASSENGPLEDEASDSEPEVMTAEAAMRLLEILGVNDASVVAGAKEMLTRQEGLVYVKREWKDMDLVVLERVHKESTGTYAPGRPLFALEIKVKDYPSAEQLLEYREVLDGKWTKKGKKTSAGDQAANYAPPLFLLAGRGNEAVKDDRLNETPTIGIDFRQISTALRQWADEDTASSPFFSEYVDLCEALDSLFKILGEVLVGSLNWGTAQKLGNQLQPYRLHSLWWKLWAAHLRQACESSVCRQDAGVSLRDYFHSHSGFTNTGNVGAYWHWQDPPRTKLKRRELPRKAISLGVQIQGNSFRLFLNLVSDKLRGKAESRLETEAALLRLLNHHGVFASNPGMQALRARWRTHAANGLSYRNSDASPTYELDTEGPIARHPLFEDVAPGKGNSVDGDTPMLPGYANGPGNGFADIRLTLADHATVSGVAELVRQVLLENLFSRSDADKASNPVLLQVVRGFEESSDDLGWIAVPTLISRD